MRRLSLYLIAATLVALAGAAHAADLDAKGSVPAMAADGHLVAVVLAEKGSLACAVSHDGGATFGAPAPAGKVEPDQMLGMRRGPQIAARQNTLVIVTNNGKGRRAVVFRSTDAGATWQGPTAIDTPAGSSPEGLLSIAPTRDGFVVAFLQIVAPKSMRIALARSTDDGKTWKDSQVIYTSPDGYVCECCQPTIASDRAGNIAVMFRNWLGGNRDMYVMTSTDDAATFGQAQKLGKGAWKLNACPMDGGGIAWMRTEKKENSLLAVFRRQNTLYTARPGEAETELGEGKSAVIAPAADGPVLAWETKTGIAVRMPKAGDLSVEGAIAPVLTATSRGVLLAYSVRDGADYRTHTRLVWESKAH